MTINGEWERLDLEAKKQGRQLGYLLGDILDRARVNADDTFEDGVRVTGEQWDRIAIGTVCSILCERDENIASPYSTATPDQARKWFAKRGIRG